LQFPKFIDRGRKLFGALMESLLANLYSKSESDFAEWISHEVLLWTEDQRIETFDLLMSMVCDFLEQPNDQGGEMALKAEFAASLIVPYDDHSLRGRIRFNTIFQKN
jgi:hypothetical protein